MPKIVFLPHEDICPGGQVVDAKPGTSVCRAALDAGIELEHSCEQACACTTCHIYIREGFSSLDAADELEEDLLDRAWGVDPDSRLSCQAFLYDEDLVIEIPKYTLNMVSEKH